MQIFYTFLSSRFNGKYSVVWLEMRWILILSNIAIFVWIFIFILWIYVFLTPSSLVSERGSYYPLVLLLFPRVSFWSVLPSISLNLGETHKKIPAYQSSKTPDSKINLHFLQKMQSIPTPHKKIPQHNKKSTHPAERTPTPPKIKKHYLQINKTVITAAYKARKKNAYNKIFIPFPFSQKNPKEK